MARMKSNPDLVMRPPPKQLRGEGDAAITNTGFATGAVFITSFTDSAILNKLVTS